MGRFLLDTNIIVFMLLGENDQLDDNVEFIIQDFYNSLNISSVTVMEIVQLYRISKIRSKKHKSVTEMITAIETDFGIKTLPFSKEHGITLTKLSVADGHNDPFDHSIIAHAITEKLTLVSSDRDFKAYIPQKLKFVFNER